jgi:hypothetical protein
MWEIGSRRRTNRDARQERCRAYDPFHDDLHPAAASKRWRESKSRYSTGKTGVFAKATMSNPKLNLSEFLNGFATASLRKRIVVRSRVKFGSP